MVALKLFPASFVHHQMGSLVRLLPFALAVSWLTSVAGCAKTQPPVVVVTRAAAPTAAVTSPAPAATRYKIITSFTLVGCQSALGVIAHLPVSLAQLIARGSFKVCHRTTCVSGTFDRAPSRYSAADFPCVQSGLGACLLRAEGSGAALWLSLYPEADAIESFVDGDRIELHVQVDGKSVLDHVRFVKYDDDHPNGMGCPGHCRGARVEIWPNSPSGQTCASERCESYVKFEGTALMTEDAAAGTVVTTCHNEDCRTSHVELWKWKYGRPEIGFPGIAVVGEGDPYGPTLEYAPDYHHGYSLRVTFLDGTRSFKRGDHFSIDWRAQDGGRILMKREQTVDAYDEVYPGGRMCVPVACKQKTFGP